MSLPRFHVPAAAPGARLRLPDQVAHHAREVLRLRPGAAARVFDGSGSEFEAVLEAVTRREVVARLGRAVASRPESPLRAVLALSPLRGDRMETVVQKATELGIAEIWPVVSSRTDAAARPALLGVRQERWEKVASSAAEQCGRAVVPRLRATLTFAQLLDLGFEGRKLLFSEAGRGCLLSAQAPSAALLLVGPPGDFEPGELQAAGQAGFELVWLGPRTLRSETAAIAAVTACQLLWGDLGRGPVPPTPGPGQP